MGTREDEIRMSPSGLVDAALCGMLTYFRYVARVRTPSSMPRLIGHAVHAAHEHALKAKARGVALTKEEVLELAGDQFDRRYNRAKEIAWSPDEKALGLQGALDTSRDQARTYAVLLHERALPRIDVYSADHVEMSLDLRVPGSGIHLRQRLDVYEARPNRIRDTKTRGTKPAASDLRSIQLEFYALTMGIALGPEQAKGLRIGLDVIQKAKKPKVWLVEGGAPTNFDALRHRIGATANALQTGSFVPVDPAGRNGWKCTAESCDFFERCAHGRRRLRAFPSATIEEVTG